MNKAQEFFKKYPDIMKHIEEQIEVECYNSLLGWQKDTIWGFDILTKMITGHDSVRYTDYRLPTKKYRYMTEREALEYIYNTESLMDIRWTSINMVLDNSGQPYTGQYTGQWYIKEITNE